MNYYMRLSEYKYRLIVTLDELKVALKEDDKQHIEVLLDRLEKRIINR